MNAKRLAIVVCIVVCGAGQVLGQTVWQQNPGNPIIGPGDPGTWDQWGHYIASVVFHGSTSLSRVRSEPDELGVALKDV